MKPWKTSSATYEPRNARLSFRLDTQSHRTGSDPCAPTPVPHAPCPMTPVPHFFPPLGPAEGILHGKTGFSYTILARFTVELQTRRDVLSFSRGERGEPRLRGRAGTAG